MGRSGSQPEYKLLSLTYKVITTSQPDYVHNLISVQSTCRTRSSSAVTLVRPSVSSLLLQITSRSFRYAMHRLTCGISSLLHSVNLILFTVHSHPGSPHPAHITSSQSPPLLSPSLLLPQSFTADLNSFFAPILSSLATHSFRTASTDLEPVLN